MSKQLSSNILHSALKLLLRPVVSFCLRHGMRLQEAVECLKAAFIDGAATSIRSRNEEISMSKLSIMTGVHRTEAARFHSGGAQEPDNQLRNIIGRWQQDKRFLNAKGTPRTLGCEGKNSEFANLVKIVSSDLSPYTVLFELERIGAIRREDNSVKLLHSIYIPKGDMKRGFELLARDSDLLTQAVEENVLSDGTPIHLHLFTRYDNIPARELNKIRPWLLLEGSKFHKRLREHLAKFDRDLNPKLLSEDKTATISVGTFSFSEEDGAQLKDLK